VVSSNRFRFTVLTPDFGKLLKRGKKEEGRGKKKEKNLDGNKRIE
jgi:hypothetical protein